MLLAWCFFCDSSWGQVIAHWAAPGPESKQIEVVAPSGEVWAFEVEPAVSMSPDLRAQWPNLRAWHGAETKPTGRRIHAVALNGELRGFVTPAHGEETKRVLRFGGQRTDASMATSTCEANVPEGALRTTMSPPSEGMPVQSRVLRLALACTGEYAAFHGGTVETALAAMVEAVNRANAVFGPEAGVQFELVGGNADLVFIDPQTDPFSNVNAFQMLGQIQSLLTAVIGPEGYDIGHVFGTGTSSIAALASACGPSKARGVSRSNTPTGEAFEVGQFCHELGHQLGANHTHSNPCSAHAPTAFEPGSGSTIMSYAGLCAPNLQSITDDEFHAHSLHEIRTFFTNPDGNGALCPSPTGAANHPPEIALPPGAHPIPPATPFALQAFGAIDPDFDDLTYSWEQRNAGEARFRSFPPSASPVRVFPANAGWGGLGDNLGETLPEAGDDLTFLCTVRDNLPTRGGVATDTLEVFVPPNSEPFSVVSWEWTAENDSTTLVWAPGTTNAPPFEDAMLQAWLSNDGGNTFTIPMAENIPNTGSATLAWPVSLHGPSYRLRLSPMDGLYFAVAPNELDATNGPGPADGVDLAMVGIAGLASDTVCGHAIAPRALVHNFGTLDASGFQLIFENLTSGDMLTLDWQEGLEAGASMEFGLQFHPDEWWTIGFGHRTLRFEVQLLDSSVSDSNPENNVLTRSLFAHCTAECPGCGCTSPAACNYLSSAIFPDEDACDLPPFGSACPCNSTLTTAAALSGGQSHTVTFNGLAGTPNLLVVSVAFDNSGSAGSLAADLAFNLCAPSGNCITCGGYNATLPGLNVGPWPVSWMSLTSGIYAASFEWPEGLETEADDGEWSFTLLNGWSSSGNVQYQASLELEGLCSAGMEGTGCPGDLNADDVVNVADLLVLLGAMGCQWECLSADLTGDGIINVQDLLGFLGSLGIACP